MKIYTEFKTDIIRVKINGTEKHFQLPNDFYSNNKKEETIKMFIDEEINSRIKHFVKVETDKLNFINRVKNKLWGNEVLSLIDNSIENIISVEQMYAYSTISFIGRNVYIIMKPNGFDSKNLNDVELIKELSVN
ncbi:hypothetical protein [Flavobacterium sp. N2820]|jgi:hypothetical protein|uniref:hypothetical protein n=1 Tax=Flavobacterium sp. N2820 TaxID=2986834 RepID=UPI0022252656|nr:hypothetical protein [Flavobacterium sp. N2820]